LVTRSVTPGRKTTKCRRPRPETKGGPSASAVRSELNNGKEGFSRKKKKKKKEKKKRKKEKSFARFWGKVQARTQHKKEDMVGNSWYKKHR